MKFHPMAVKEIKFHNDDDDDDADHDDDLS